MRVGLGVVAIFHGVLQLLKQVIGGTSVWFGSAFTSFRRAESSVEFLSIFFAVMGGVVLLSARAVADRVTVLLIGTNLSIRYQEKFLNATGMAQQFSAFLSSQ